MITWIILVYPITYIYTKWIIRRGHPHICKPPSNLFKYGHWQNAAHINWEHCADPARHEIEINTHHKANAVYICLATTTEKKHDFQTIMQKSKHIPCQASVIFSAHISHHSRQCLRCLLVCRIKCYVLLFKCTLTFRSRARAYHREYK